MKAELFIPSNDQLGEGPLWDHRSDELLWVDIEAGKVHVTDWKSKKRATYHFSSRIGCVAAIENSKEYIVALQDGLARFDRMTGTLVYLANPEPDMPNNRFNDGKCDPQGRFWVGSMDVSASEGKGSLYCMNHDLSMHKKLSQLSIANGMAWDTQKDIMYFIDTAANCVTALNYDPATAEITQPKRVIMVPEAHGYPDGMTIDQEGMLWIAHWGGANISRWHPESGQLLAKIEVPALHVSSLCFAGELLDTLVITSARTGLSKSDLKKYPLSGSVFKYTPKIPGNKTAFFKPNQT